MKGSIGLNTVLRPASAGALTASWMPQHGYLFNSLKDVTVSFQDRRFDMGGATIRAMTLLSLVLACVGCAGKLDVSGAILTSGASLQAGKRVEVAHFTRQDLVTQLVDFSWSDVEQNGGRHVVTWKWYKDDVLVSKTPSRYLTFDSTPYTLHTTRAAATLGIGNFKVETIVDDQVVATSRFDIAA